MTAFNCHSCRGEGKLSPLFSKGGMFVQEYKLILTEEELRLACEELAKNESIGLDIETTSLEPRNGEIRLIQLGVTPKEVPYIIDLLRYEGCFIHLKYLLENPSVIKVIHNAKFESGWFIAKFGIYIQGMFCTYLGSRMLVHDAPHDLASVASRYIGIAINKDEQQSDWSRPVLTEQQMQYAAIDAIHLTSLRAIMRQRIVQNGMTETAQIEFGAIHAISKLENTGYPVDVSMYADLVEHLRKDRDEKAKKLQEIVRATRPQAAVQVSMFEEISDKDYYEVNLNSPIQITKAFRDLGVPILSNKKDVALIQQYLEEGKKFITSTQYDDVVTIVEQYPVLTPLVDYRKAQKLFGSYGQPVFDAIENGRIYATYWQIGAETGRMSCSNPNLQQVPADDIFRKCFRAPEGYKLIVADYAGFELRILAEYSQDPVLLRIFRDGLDMHSMTTSSVFGIPYEEIEANRRKYKKERHLGKILNFGIVYGMGYQTYAQRTGVSEEEAKIILDKFKKAYPVMDKWLYEQGKAGLKSLLARTKSGRLVRFSDPGDNKGQQGAVRRNARNTPIQGTNADVIKIAAREVEKALRKYDAEIVNIVHDELNVLAHESCAEEVESIVESEMVKAGEIYIKSVPVLADAQICTDWSEKK